MKMIKEIELRINALERVLEELYQEISKQEKRLKKDMKGYNKNRNWVWALQVEQAANNLKQDCLKKERYEDEIFHLKEILNCSNKA